MVVGSLATMLTSVELDISRNDRLGKEAFFIADAGSPIASKVLQDMIIREGIDYSDPEYNVYMSSNINFDSTIFVNEVMNYYDPETEPDLNDKLVDTPENDPDIETTLSDSTLAIDVDWRYRKSGAGASLLFAMGYEGIGVDRSHGGVKTYYNIAARGKVLDNIISEIGSVYIFQ